MCKVGQTVQTHTCVGLHFYFIGKEITMSDKKPIIKLEHLGKKFETASGTVHALDDINLEIEQGEIFGIIGLSGAGKSTLVRCMNYLEVPTGGSVIFDGVNISAVDNDSSKKGNYFTRKYTERKLERIRRDARKSMGMIFQQFNLLAQRNVLQNVCFPLEIMKVPSAEAKKRAEELLKLVGLEDKAKAYPAQLSGGQKQRVAIARAIASNPKVLLCDEATSALDPNTTKSILELLKKISRELGITVVVITHEMAVIEAICDRVAIIDSSHIAEIGRVSEIFAEPKSKIGKQLILGDAASCTEVKGEKKYRIIFDGRSSFEPVISNLVLACKIPVNILYAKTKDIQGKALGQMIIQIPEAEGNAEKVVKYLKTMHVTFEEVDDHDI